MKIGIGSAKSQDPFQKLGDEAGTVFRLAPGHRGRAKEGDGRAEEEHDWRHRYRRPAQEERNERSPERAKVQDRNDNDGMSMAEADVIEDEARGADREDRSQFPIVRPRAERADKTAATVGGDQQKRDRDEKRDLGQENELEDAQLLGGGRR